MKEIKGQYYKNLTRNWLFNAFLLFSVFSFSGFNVQIQSAFNESTQTELSESRERKPAFKFNKHAKEFSNVQFANPLLRNRSFNKLSLLNHNIKLETEYKFLRNKYILFATSPLKVLSKIPSSSSQDGIPPSFLS